MLKYSSLPVWDRSGSDWVGLRRKWNWHIQRGEENTLINLSGKGHHGLAEGEGGGKADRELRGREKKKEIGGAFNPGGAFVGGGTKKKKTRNSGMTYGGRDEKSGGTGSVAGE